MIYNLLERSGFSEKVTSSDTDKSGIRKFLKSFKKATQESGLFLYPTTKNEDTLLEFGINRKIQEEIIKELTVLDYVSGPEPDKNKWGDQVWIFGKEVKGTEHYIKIKIRSTRYGDKATCLSFHPAERPIKYKFKEENQ